MAHTDPPTWPSPSVRGQELIREAALRALDPGSGLLEDLYSAALSTESMRPIANDPILADGARRTTRTNMTRWLTANVEHPGVRVRPELDHDMLSTARDLVRRGLDKDALESYRTSQAVAWRRFLGICFDLTSDPDELRELVDLVGLSISCFIDDSIRAVGERMDAERAELTRGSHAERRATVMLLLEGAPVDQGRSERQLGYRFTGPHTAVILWSPAATGAADLEAAAEAIMRACGAGRRLTVVAGAGALWVWLPVAWSGPTSDLTAAVTAQPEVRIAVGRTRDGMVGFRRSHLDAATVQRFLDGSPSGRQLATFADVELVQLVTDDPSNVDEFIHDTVGALASADRDLRELTLTYIASGCNAAETATRLYTHRNTVVRRLAQVDGLLPRPLRDNIVHVAAALEILAWRSARR
ncbi:PucR family transcriptional regulator [Gordonia sp. NPDC003376]